MENSGNPAVFHLISFVKLWRIEFIILPIRHIVVDIIRNAVHIRGVAYDMVVKTGLPGEI